MRWRAGFAEVGLHGIGGAPLLSGMVIVVPPGAGHAAIMRALSLHRQVALRVAAHDAQHQLWRLLREAGAETGQVVETGRCWRPIDHVALAAGRCCAARLPRATDLDQHAVDAGLAQALGQFGEGGAGQARIQRAAVERRAAVRAGWR